MPCDVRRSSLPVLLQDLCRTGQGRLRGGPGQEGGQRIALGRHRLHDFMPDGDKLGAAVLGDNLGHDIPPESGANLHQIALPAYEQGGAVCGQAGLEADGGLGGERPSLQRGPEEDDGGAEKLDAVDDGGGIGVAAKSAESLPLIVQRLGDATAAKGGASLTAARADGHSKDGVAALAGQVMGQTEHLQRDGCSLPSSNWR